MESGELTWCDTDELAYFVHFLRHGVSFRFRRHCLLLVICLFFVIYCVYDIYIVYNIYMSSDVIIIPKEVARRGDLVVVPKKEYEKFVEWQNEAEDALEKVRRGRDEHKRGKTESPSSPRSFR